MWEPEGIFSMPSHIMSLLCPNPSNGGASLSQGETQVHSIPRRPSLLLWLHLLPVSHPSLCLSHTGLLAVPQAWHLFLLQGLRLVLLTWWLSHHGIHTTSSSLLSGLLGKDLPEDSIENSILYHCFLYSLIFSSSCLLLSIQYILMWLLIVFFCFLELKLLNRNLFSHCFNPSV